MCNPIRPIPSAPAFRRASVCASAPAPGAHAGEPRPLPPFVSSAPPRSEGEALLRRIFTRGTCVS